MVAALEPPASVGGRVIAYDRRGHGGSDAPEPYLRATVQEHGEDLVALVETLAAAPAVLVGEDVGALVVLDVVLRHPAVARAAVLVDPPAYQFVAEATEALSEDRAALEEAVRAGGPDAGVDWWLAERGREPRPGLTARGFFADFGALASLPLSRRELAAVDLPVAVVISEHARLHDVAAARALADALADAWIAPSLGEALEGTERHDAG
jgi:pimeloyl-ACP methyl ester carboxylesterase